MNTSRFSQTLLLSVAALSTKAALAVPAARADDSVSTRDDQLGETSLNINFEFIRETVKTLQARLASDMDYRARFTANPRRVLAELGLPAEVQMQILIEEGAGNDVILPEELACSVTCVCTGCCKTN